MAAKKKKTTSAPAPAPVMPAANPWSGKKLLPGDPNLTPEAHAVLEKVREFEIAERTIELFEEDPQNAQVMQMYKVLVEERNQKLQAAEHAVRGLDVSCGPFERYSESVKWNPDALFQRMGKQGFLEVGGSISTETIYKVDRARADIAASTGAIPPAILPEVRKVTPSFRVPKPRG